MVSLNCNKGGEKMKKRRLKKWVKVVLVIMGVLMIIGMCKGLSKLDEKQLENCMSAGHSQSYCEKGLR